MSKNINDLVSKFKSLELQKQKDICLTILSLAKNKGGIFAELNSLVAENRATEFDLLNIYQSAMEVLEETNEQNKQKSMYKLEKIRNSMQKIKEIEENERMKEKQDSENILTNIL